VTKVRTKAIRAAATIASDVLDHTRRVTRLGAHIARGCSLGLFPRADLLSLSANSASVVPLAGVARRYEGERMYAGTVRCSSLIDRPVCSQRRSI
jgi:hypothetical protein